MVEIGDVRLVFRFLMESSISATVEAVPPDPDEGSESSETDSLGEVSTMDLITGLDGEVQLRNRLPPPNSA